MTHIWEHHRDACWACGRSAQEIAEHKITECDGEMKYREWLRDMVFSREPIEPGARDV